MQGLRFQVQGLKIQGARFGSLGFRFVEFARLAKKVPCLVQDNLGASRVSCLVL